jgi:RNA recognition motif-containing protein
VGNLGGNVTALELQELFAAAGAVKWADVAKDARTGRCKGFGFVQMKTPDAARRALVSLNGRAHGGRFLTVTESHPKGGPPSKPLTSPARPRPSTRRGYRAAR